MESENGKYGLGLGILSARNRKKSAGIRIVKMFRVV